MLQQQAPAKAPLAERMAQAQAIAKTGKPLPPELAGDKEVLNAMTQGFAQASTGEDMDAATVQRNAQAGRDIMAGVPEGGRRIWAGLKQTGAEIKDAYNLFVKGKPTHTENAVRATNGQLIRRENEMLDSTKTKPVIAEELMRRQLQEAEDVAAGASRTGRNAVAKTVELGTLALAPEAALPRATTLTGGMLKNSAAGAIGGGLEFDAQPNSNALIGATAAPVFGVVPSLIPAVKNYVGRALARVSADGRTSARVAAAREALPNVDYSLAQVTGVPELKTLERAAYDSKMVNFFADQTDKFVEDAVKVLRQPMKDGQTLANDFVAARARADKNLHDFKQAANINYDNGMAEAARISEKVVGGARAQVPAFTEQLKVVAQEARDPISAGGQQVLSEKFIRGLQSATAKGNLTMHELARTLKGLTNLHMNGTPVQKAMAKRLHDALDADLDRLAADGALTADDATKQILETRAEYRRAQNLIRELGESGAYKLLGVSEPSASADELVQKLQSFTPEKRASIRDYMESNSPELLVSMKDAVVRDAAKRAATIREAADSQQSLDQMMDAMFDAKNGYDMRTSGIWNAEELKRIEGIKDGMRVIANNRPALGGSGTPIKPEDVAINLVSRHSAFVARQLTRILMSAKASQFFTDPRVYERLTKMRRSTTGSPTNLIARAALLDLMQDDYATEE